MIKNKKGIMEDAMYWIFRIILIMLIVFALVLFVNSIIKKNIDTGKLELNLITARVINSKDCLAKVELINEVEKVKPGFVDLTKYDETYLKTNCVIGNSSMNLGLKITIKDLEPKYINKEKYEDLEPLTFSSKYQKVTKHFPIITVDKNGVEISKTIEIIAVERKR